AAFSHESTMQVGPPGAVTVTFLRSWTTPQPNTHRWRGSTAWMRGRGVNPWKWTHQCVLSGGDVHHKCVIDLEVNRCSITQTRMSPPRVVSNQPPKHLATTLEVRDPPLRSLQRLPLQRRVDRLRQGIISTRPDPAHRLDHPEPTTHRLKRRGLILTTMVAVNNRTFQCFSVVYCIL